MSDETAATEPESHNTGFVPGDDFATRWGNHFRYLTGRMTLEGVMQSKKYLDDRNEIPDRERCEKHRDFVLKYSQFSSILHIPKISLTECQVRLSDSCKTR